MRRGPSRIPIVGELFEEGSFQIRRLDVVSDVIKKVVALTVKVGRSAGLEVSTNGSSAASCARVVPARRAVAYSAAWRRILSKRECDEEVDGRREVGKRIYVDARKSKGVLSRDISRPFVYCGTLAPRPLISPDFRGHGTIPNRDNGFTEKC